MARASVKSRSILSAVEMLLRTEGEGPSIILISALTSEEWAEVVADADERALPALRRLRKLGLHRNWRLRNAEQERERHRDYYAERRRAA